jgi:hypothetical protein
MAKKNIGNDVGALDAIDTFATDFGVEIDGVEDESDRKLLHYLAFGVPPYRAALRAGKPIHYAKKTIYDKLKKNKKFQTQIDDIRGKIRERYLAFATDCLPEIAWVERKVLSNLAANPDSINPTTAKIMRDLKKTAGVLVDEPRTPEFMPVRIAIQVQAHLAQQQVNPQQLKTNIVDADAEETT